MKYVIVETAGIETAIVFSELLKHTDVVMPRQAISAGFCSYDDGKVNVWGKSVSLDKFSRPEDSQIIEDSFKFRGF
jgi:hypothetical protein